VPVVKTLLGVLFAFIVLGCSALDFAKIGKSVLGASDKGGLSVDAQIGDRKNDVDTDVGSTNTTGNVSAKGNGTVRIENESASSKVESAEKVTVNNVPVWIVLLALLGWVCPTPQDMVRKYRDRR
jgi:hypothetical protein